LIINRIIKNVCVSDFKKNNKNEGIHYNFFIISNIKIVVINIPMTNLVAVGIFSRGTKTSIIRFYLLYMIISFINYTGDKNDYFKSDQIKEINAVSKMNNINFSNFLHSKIYDSFLSIPTQIYFGKMIQKIFKKRTLYIKDIYYKNFYLIDLNNNKIVLSLDNLYNKDKNNNNNIELKIFKKKKIKKELLFFCKELKKEYIDKNKMNFSEFEFQKYFIKLEYKATYPRRTFIIKFLPILNGMCIIHEYIQLKLSTFEKGDTIKEKYKEKDVIYGFDLNDKNDSCNYLFENEHYILKQLHLFIIESLFCSNSSFSSFFYFDKRPKIYFSKEILDIINNQIVEFLEKNKNVSLYLQSQTNKNNYFSKKIIQKIINQLYEEYIQINSAEKILHKSSSALPLKSSINSLSFKDINFGKKSNSLQITKDEALTYLFNSIKFNKNIDPNDITIDLNDDKNNDNDNENKSPRVSELIDRNSKPSLRLSDLLAENINICPTQEKMKNGGDIIQNYHPFPRDSELNSNSINKDSWNNYKKESEEINIGTKMRKKYYYNNLISNNNNHNEYNSIYNINHKKNKHIFSYNNNNVYNDKNNERFFLNEKMSVEHLNQNDKSDKLLNKRLFN
jgi:hypothetical protein